MLTLYLSLAGDRAIACYRVDAASGALEPIDRVEVAGEPSVQGRHPRLPVLYAGVRSTGHLLSFRIDAAGRLRPIGDIDTGLTDPAYLATDRAGRFLLTPYYESAVVSVYPIGADGAAHGPPACVAEADAHAHGVAVSRDGCFAFVSHACPGNAIRTFRLQADGRLEPRARLACPPQTGPRHVHCHPRLPLVYTDDEQGNSVSAYRLDEATGALTHAQALSTVPPGWTGGACACMELHPNGRCLYAANRGHDSLAVFAIGADGALQGRGQVPTEENPRSFHLDPGGRFLYAAGQSADRLAAYRIDPATGDLTPMATYPTGRVPWWVQVVETG